jgi:F-box and WD-40 domain protein CDC4
MTDEHALIGNRNGQLQLFEPDTAHIMRQMNDHTSWINCIVYCPKLSRVITGTFDKTARVWNVQTGECTHTLVGNGEIVWCVAFDGTTIVIGSNDKKVLVWHAPYITDKCDRVIEGHTNAVKRVWLCTALNEQIVISVDMDSTVRIHRTLTGDRVCAPIECVFCKLFKQSHTHHVYRPVRHSSR